MTFNNSSYAVGSQNVGRVGPQGHIETKNCLTPVNNNLRQRIWDVCRLVGPGPAQALGTLGLTARPALAMQQE